MSELFNALQKLEEKNTPDAPLPPPVSRGCERENPKRLPYQKSILFLLLILAVTGAGMVFLWSQKHSSFLHTIAAGTSKVPKKQPAVANEQLPTIAGEGDPLPKPADEPVSVPEVAVTEKKKNAFSGPLTTSTVNENSIVVGKMDKIDGKGYLPDIIATNQNVGKTVDTSAQEEIFRKVRKEQSRTQKKRLVYRAEKLRGQGDYIRALLLYREAWRLEPDSALANNLAALLLESEEYEEAERYLREALQMTPDDEDLQFNLTIAVQGKKRQ